MIREELSALMKECREFHGIGYNEIKNKTQLSGATISSIESGTRNYRLDFILQYLRVCKSILVLTKNNYKYSILTIEDFIKIIHDVLEEKQLTKRSLSERCNWPGNAVGKILNRKAVPTVDKVLKISYLGGYEVTVEDITDKEKQDVDNIIKAGSQEMVLPLFIFGQSEEEGGVTKKYVTCTDSNAGFIATVTFSKVRPSQTHGGIILYFAPYFTKFQVVMKINHSADNSEIQKLMRRCTEEYADFFKPKNI